MTNLDKELFPGRDGEPPITKRELLRYHARTAPWILPYLHDRPVNMHRYPNGAGATGFWQNARPAHAPERPTWALIDVDPGPETSHDDLLLMVRLHRTALKHLGVQAGCKTTGKRGFQIWIPVEPRYTFAETRGWVEQLSRTVGATIPELVSWKWTKEDRRGLARLDYTQNAINKTLVAPLIGRPQHLPDL